MTSSQVPPALDEALRPLEAVHRLMTALHRATSPAGFYHEAVDAVVTTLGVDRASLLLFDPDGVMRFKAWRGLSDGYRRAVEGHTPWTPEDTSARPILVPDVAADPDLAGYLPTFRAEGIGALAFIPLLTSAGVVGKFMLYYDGPHDFTDAEIAVAEILAADVALLLERARLFDDRERALEAEAGARLAAERAHARIASLADASAALAESLDYDETLHRVADAVVPRLADACALYLKTDDGDIALAALRHRSPQAEAHIRTVLERFPPRTTDRMGFGAVMRTATTEIYTEIGDKLLGVWSAYGGVEHLDLLRAIDMGWVMLIPLVSRQQILGVLGLMNERGHALEDDTVSLANTLAARAATAIDNARLFRDRTAIAQQLQASLLPPQLPDVPGVDLAGRYSAAGTGIDVGGDFYDVFPLDARRFVAVLGDVCGRGLKAATLATRARYTIRSAAVTLADPAAILANLNEVLLRRQEPAGYEPQFCTAVVAVVEPLADGVVVELAVAGHPLPMHLTADGAVTPVGVPGSLLGVEPDATATATSVHLRPGDALVCVTDGVLERRHGPAFFGESGLTTTLKEAAGGDAEGLAAAVEAATLGFSPDETTDDFAVLVLVARRTECSPGPGLPAGEEGDDRSPQGPVAG